MVELMLAVTFVLQQIKTEEFYTKLTHMVDFLYEAAVASI
jgi:hypothetical protein